MKIHPPARRRIRWLVLTGGVLALAVRSVSAAAGTSVGEGPSQAPSRSPDPTRGGIVRSVCELARDDARAAHDDQLGAQVLAGDEARPERGPSLRSWTLED